MLALREAPFELTFHDRSPRRFDRNRAGWAYNDEEAAVSRAVFETLKNAVLILEEVKRLGENLKKLTDRIEALERRQIEVDKAMAVGEVRDAALIDRFDAATRVAASETHRHLAERLTRLECASALQPGVGELQAMALPLPNGGDTPRRPNTAGKSRRRSKPEAPRSINQAATPLSEASPSRKDRDQ